MAKNEKASASEPEVSDGKIAAETTATAAVGTRARRAFMLKNFVPDIGWINKHVVAHGKGTKIMVGRIVGHVHGVTVKNGFLPNGEPSMSLVLDGEFEAESYLDGEVSTCSSVYYSGSFPNTIKSMFDEDKSLKTVEIDTDIGIEATGKGIPYTWVVVNYREGIDMTPLRKLRLSRPKPEGIPKLENNAPKALASS